MSSEEGDAAVRTEIDHGVATLWINNPPINLFDRSLAASLHRAVDHVEKADDVRVLLLRSALPGWFIAHFDIGWVLAFDEDRPDSHGLCEQLRTMPKATIAVIEGRCGGFGSELALSCDMRFAALGQAVFNQPEIALGIFPAGSGSQRLNRLCGRGRAMEIILSGDDFDAETAELYGWINRALLPAELGLFVDRLAQRIASWSPNAIGAAKESVLRAEKEVEADLQSDSQIARRMSQEFLTRRAMEKFLAIGGQTVHGEERLGELLAELREFPTE